MENIAIRFAQIIFGLAIIGLDVRLGRFDVLPDCVGYILVALGAGGLIAAGRPFHLAKVLSWLLVGISAAGVLLHGYFGMTVRILQVPLDAVMMWFLLGGAMEIALHKQRPDLVNRATICRIAYVALSCVIALTVVIGRALPSLASGLGTLNYIAMLCLLAVILHLFYQLKQANSQTGDAAVPQ